MLSLAVAQPFGGSHRMNHSLTMMGFLFAIMVLINDASAAKTSAGAVQKSETLAAKPPAQKATPAKAYKKSSYRDPKTIDRINSPRKSSNKIQVVVTKTKSGDMVMLLEKANGSSPFVFLTMNYLKQHKEFMQNHLNINFIFNRCDQDNPHAYKTEIVTNEKGENERHWNVLVHIVAGGDEAMNTSANRRRWAETFVAFFNHPANQAKYSYPLEAHFTGDLTPQNENESPEFSHYLTIRDTMTVMRVVLNETGDANDRDHLDGMASVRTCLGNEAAMRDFYKPTHLEQARAFYVGHVNGEGNNQEEPEAEDEFADLPRYNYDRA